MSGLINFDLTFNDNDGNFTFANLVNLIRDVEDRTSRSLPQYIKRSTIASRVFIQKECAEEEVLSDLLMTLQQMYIGWILTAVQMNTYVDSTRTVRTALDVVATEDMKYVATDDLLSGFENFTKAKMNVVKEKPIVSSHGGSGVVKTVPNELNLPSGRIVEVKLNAGGENGKSTPITVNLYVQLMPTFIPSVVAKEFFLMHFKPSLAQRWFQVTAGEKKFISDFLLELDLLKNRREALKKDTTGELREMLKRQDNGLANFLLKLAGVYPEKQNVANTIHIYEKNSFDRWCHDSGCNFKRMSDRTKFFNRTFSMCAAVIDSAYGRVDMYFHGIDNRGEYNFSQIKQQAKNERYDLQTIMKAYYQSSAPKF